ncbi:MAG: MmcQ/YjbR family DNA-binding protein [Bryobacteraceae bacterium]|nr:MmcQ/YjbR family DNA-binding protein [Bryobacteraceae bacterium]
MAGSLGCMDVEWVRAICVALPGAAEEILWESELVFKVGGKMFCVVSLEPGSTWLSFKADEESFAELLERPGIVPAPYLARAKWVALETEDALPPGELKERLERSWRLVVDRLPKKARERIMDSRRPAPPARG